MLSALLDKSTNLAHLFKVMRGCAVLLEVNESFLVTFV
jgi:hypothetical protein